MHPYTVVVIEPEDCTAHVCYVFAHDSEHATVKATDECEPLYGVVAPVTVFEGHNTPDWVRE